ncbi:MAG: hypothetical protein AB3N20_03250 [Rhizobiaceae bacterium]
MSSTLIWIGVAAAVCLLAPVAYTLLKRSAADVQPRLWFSVHVIGSLAGVCLAIIHSGGQLLSPPGALLVLLGATVILGGWIRLNGSTRFAHRMGARPNAFLGGGLQNRQTLRKLIDDKIELLGRLEPAANEALFSPQLKHWLDKPVLSARYLRLMEKERHVSGARSDAGAVTAWSRRIHMVLGALFVAGLAIHIGVALYRILLGGVP